METTGPINPVEALVEKRTTLDNLISNGLAVPIYLEEEEVLRISENKSAGESFTEYSKSHSKQRKIIAAMIQVSDDVVIVTGYDNLQMQAIKMSEESLKKESEFNKIMTKGEASLSHHSTKVYTPFEIFQTSVSFEGSFSSKILADSASEPDTVVELLSKGLTWLKQKQELQLKNRTKASDQFNSILKDFLKSDE